jgi:phosphoribosylglycinamide formyltransferase-1
MKKIAVFASGNGSNFQALIDAVEAGQLDVSICLLVIDKADAYAIQRAKLHNIDTFTFKAKDYDNKAAFEQVILGHLRERDVDYIVLAGYMRLIGETLLRSYEGRIINIHPSILPSFPGKDAIGQAFTAKVKITGVTIHFVDEGMDTGPIIAQEAVYLDDDETNESLTKKIQAVEHKLYPKTLRRLFS